MPLLKTGKKSGDAPTAWPSALSFEDRPNVVPQGAWIVTVWLHEISSIPRGLSGDFGGLADPYARLQLLPKANSRRGGGGGGSSSGQCDPQQQHSSHRRSTLSPKWHPPEKFQFLVHADDAWASGDSTSWPTLSVEVMDYDWYSREDDYLGDATLRLSELKTVKAAMAGAAKAKAVQPPGKAANAAIVAAAEKAAAEVFALDGELCELQLWDQHKTGEVLVGEGHVKSTVTLRVAAAPKSVTLDHRIDVIVEYSTYRNKKWSDESGATLFSLEAAGNEAATAAGATSSADGTGSFSTSRARSAWQDVFSDGDFATVVAVLDQQRALVGRHARNMVAWDDHHGSWEIDTRSGDPHGWQYADNFHSKPHEWGTHTKYGCRRRHWLRKLRAACGGDYVALQETEKPLHTGSLKVLDGASAQTRFFALWPKVLCYFEAEPSSYVGTQPLGALALQGLVVFVVSEVDGDRSGVFHLRSGSGKNALTLQAVGASAPEAAAASAAWREAISLAEVGDAARVASVGRAPPPPPSPSARRLGPLRATLAAAGKAILDSHFLPNQKMPLSPRQSTE